MNPAAPPQSSAPAVRYCVHTGPSMAPTLREGDLLEIAPCSAVDLRIGDVIVFASPGDPPLIVHRVIATSGGQIRTRGDRNDFVDPPVAGEAIVGRVTAAWRGGVRRQIAGGMVGYARITALRSVLPLAREALRLLPPRRAALAMANAWVRLGKGPLRPRTVAFHTPSGVRERILAGRFVVAERAPGVDRWRIHYPFRLAVDETALALLVNAASPG